MRVVNVPMRLALRLPFPTPLNRRLMLLSFTGRQTGRAYLQPVSYVPEGDTLLTPGRRQVEAEPSRRSAHPPALARPRRGRPPRVRPGPGRGRTAAGHHDRGQPARRLLRPGHRARRAHRPGQSTGGGRPRIRHHPMAPRPSTVPAPPVKRAGPTSILACSLVSATPYIRSPDE